MISKEDIAALLERYEAGTCTPQEKALIEKWFAARQGASGWQWENEEERLQVQQMMRSYITARIFPDKRKTGRVRLIKGLSVAAAVLLCCMAAAWLFRARHTSVQPGAYVQQAVKPGSHAALLTLANGAEIHLDDAKEGVLFDDNGIKVSKQANGQLRYDIAALPGGQAADAGGNNTISIPRGGQYQLTLPDGTVVQLNSATSLTWPAAFNNRERIVYLSGEAYFDVTKNSSKPFKVMARGTEVLATGTQFNIAAYQDETLVLTTLVEGGVNVTAGNAMVSLKPGQQAITANSGPIQKKNVDTDLALAWTQGNFLFEDQDIRSIMRSVARWYNVEVNYEGIPDMRTFGGTYTRSKGLEELLQHLESLSNVRFRINKNKVTVML